MGVHPRLRFLKNSLLAANVIMVDMASTRRAVSRGEERLPIQGSEALCRSGLGSRRDLWSDEGSKATTSQVTHVMVLPPAQPSHSWPRRRGLYCFEALHNLTFSIAPIDMRALAGLTIYRSSSFGGTTATNDCAGSAFRMPAR